MNEMVLSSTLQSSSIPKSTKSIPNLEVLMGDVAIVSLLRSKGEGRMIQH
jgi:hypothetical protein